MNWSGGGKKRFRPKIGLHITKPLFRHQNRIPLVDDQYIQEMISKSTKGKRKPMSPMTSPPTNSERKQDGCQSSGDNSPASLFGDIPLGTPSEPATDIRHRDKDFYLYDRTTSQKSDDSDISYITIHESQPIDEVSSKIPNFTPNKSPSFQTVENESGLFEGDDLSNYCSPEESDASFLKANCYYLKEFASPQKRSVEPYKPGEDTFKSWDTTVLSEKSTPVRKQVRFGTVNDECTPVHLPECSVIKNSQTYRKTPITKVNETLSDCSSEKSVIEPSPRRNSGSSSSGSHQQINGDVQLPWLESSPPMKDEPCSEKGVVHSTECDSGSQPSERSILQTNKPKNQYLKTKKKLIFKKVILREKVIHKTFKIVKTRDTATQTTP